MSAVRFVCGARAGLTGGRCMAVSAASHGLFGGFRPRRTVGTGCAMLFGVPFLAVGLSVLSWGVWQGYLNLVEVRTWKEVQATVISKRIEEKSDSDGATYRPVIEFEYEVEGRLYRSHRYDISNVSSSGRAAKEHILDGYEVGGTCTAYYDPDDASRAVLSRETSYLFVMLIMFGLVFAGVGSGFVFGPAVGTLVKRRRESRLAAGVGIGPRFDRDILGPWVFTLFWNGITYTVYFGFALADEELPWFVYLFFVPFMLIGALALSTAVRATLVRRKFRGLRLGLESSPVRAGEEVRFTISGARGPVEGAGTVRAYLVFRRQSGEDQRWHTEHKEEVAEMDSIRGSSPRFEGRITMPLVLPEISDDEKARAGWFVRLAIGWRRCHFPLPVEPAPA